MVPLEADSDNQKFTERLIKALDDGIEAFETLPKVYDAYILSTQT